MALQSQIISNEGEKSHRKPRPHPVRLMQKVPELLLQEEQNFQDYIPKVVSIGPYHHGKPKLGLAESIKPQILEMILLGDKGKEYSYYQEIINEIISIRNCYQHEFTHLYSDDYLARMMLHDASFLIIRIETGMPTLPPSDVGRCYRFFSFLIQTLGMLTTSIAFHDIFLLENQIPLWIVKLLLSARYNEEETQELLNRYTTMFFFGEFRPKRSPPRENEEELHLLEAFNRFLSLDCVRQPEKTRNCRFFRCFQAKQKTVVDQRIMNANPNTNPESDESYRKKSWFSRACKRLIKNDNKSNYAKQDVKKFLHSFRSVTDLKAKGIFFEPSASQSLRDVQFESNCFYGKLQLPTWNISMLTKRFFLNMIAYEFNPNNPNQGVVTTYLNLMQLLIVRSEDVKELREKKILFCFLGSDERILKMYQDINTFGAYNAEIFQDVKDRIQAHYSSKSKTWIAELIHTYLRTPWTVITLFAAMCLLVLTILQTIYTMKS